MRVVGRRATSRGEDECDDTMTSIRTRRIVSRAGWIEPSMGEEDAREGSTAPRWNRSARGRISLWVGRGRGGERPRGAETVGVQRGARETPRVRGGMIYTSRDASMRRGDRMDARDERDETRD